MGHKIKDVLERFFADHQPDCAEFDGLCFNGSSESRRDPACFGNGHTGPAYQATHFNFCYCYGNFKTFSGYKDLHFIQSANHQGTC